MLLRNKLSRREQVRATSRSQVLRAAVSRAVCETLESRQLLTAFTFNVPQNDGYAAVYLQAHQTDGWVNVRKNSATGTIVHTFTGDNNNGTGMYIVDAGDIDNFLFVDQVAAARKPTATTQAPNDNGILMKASGPNATGGHLKIEMQAADHYAALTESSASGATIALRESEFSGATGNSRSGAGVNLLTIQTNCTTTGTEVQVAYATVPGDPGLPGLDPNTSLHIDSLGVSDVVRIGGAAEASVQNTVVRTGKGNNLVAVNQGASEGYFTDVVVDFDPSLGGNDGWLRMGGKTGANCTVTLADAPRGLPRTTW